MKPWPARIRQGLGWTALYALAAALVFWRLLPHMGTHLPHVLAEPDLHVGFWMPWNLGQQLAGGGSPFQAPGVMWPYGMDLTLYVWNLGCPLLAAPLYAIFPPILAANLATLGYATANGLAGHLLGARVGGTRAAAVATGLVATWAFEPLYELCSGRPEQGFIAPVILASLFFFRVLDEPQRWGPRLGLGLSVAASGICYWFQPVLLAVALLPALLLLLILRRVSLRALGSCALSAVICGVAALPALLPVLLALRAPDNTLQRAMQGGFSASRLLVDRLEQSYSLASMLWPALPADRATLDHAFPLVLLLAVVATLAWAPLRRRGWPWALLALAGLVLALGPRLQLVPSQPLQADGPALPFALLDHLPGFGRFWWPRRFAVPAFVGLLGVLASLVGAFRVGRQGWVLGGAAAVLLLAEAHLLAPVGRAGVAGGPVWDLRMPQLYAELARAPGSQPLIQLPLGVLPSAQVMDQPFHRQPIFGTIVQGNPDLVPIVQQERAAEPPFSWLSAVGGVATPAGAPAPRVLKQALAGEGFRWVILRTDLPAAGPQAAGQAVALLGSPDVREDGLLAWALTPAP